MVAEVVVMIATIQQECLILLLRHVVNVLICTILEKMQLAVYVTDVKTHSIIPMSADPIVCAVAIEHGQARMLMKILLELASYVMALFLLMEKRA